MKSIISKEFIIYCIVGLVNTLVGLLTAFIALNVFFLSYSIATTLSYLVGINVSFHLNKKYTFKNKDKSFIQFIKFFATMLPAYIFSYWAGYQIAHFADMYFTKTLNFLQTITNMPQLRLIDNFALIISMAIYLFVGFTINKFIVFSKKK